MDSSYFLKTFTSRVSMRNCTSMDTYYGCSNRGDLGMHTDDDLQTEKVQTCSRLRLNTSKLVFAMKMTLAFGMA